MADIQDTACSSDAKKLQILEDRQKIIDRNPFAHLKIDDASCLDSIEGREICGTCYRSRKFFCYSCCKLVICENYVPKIKLPIKIDIIKHKQEIDGKSTSCHAAIIAPDDVKIYTYPDFPDIREDEKTVLIFPSKTASSVEELFVNRKDKGNEIVARSVKDKFPITRAVFIDSTWHQTKSIYKDQRLRDLPCIILKTRISQFWRHQKKSPRWYLATIEAIHQFLVELHVNAFGQVENYVENEKVASTINVKSIVTEAELFKPYNGQYDNLLYFFKYMYEKIHSIYDHEKLWAYKRPLL